jgi:hypothetical protein
MYMCVCVYVCMCVCVCSLLSSEDVEVGPLTVTCITIIDTIILADYTNNAYYYVT